MSQSDLRKVSANLAGVVEGLEQVVGSMKAAGYVDALPGYRQMKLALLQQRLWSLSRMTPELDKRWQDIAKRSQEASDILTAFATTMSEISKVAMMAEVSELVPPKEESV